MSTRFLHTFWVAAAAILTSSCGDVGYDNSPRGPLELSHTAITVGKATQVVTVGVTAREAGWTVTGAEEWCAVDVDSGGKGTAQVGVTFTENGGDGARTATLVFRSGTAEKTIPVEQLNVDIEPNRHADAPINKAVHDLLCTWYYNGEPKNVAPDLNQSYSDFYKNYLEHLALNEYDGNTWTQDNTRYIYSRIESRPAGQALAPLNYGMEFDLQLFNNVLVGRVLYVEEGSPAQAAGLKRGDWFNRVNAMTLATGTTSVGDFRYYYNRVIDSLVHPVEGHSPVLGMMTFNGAQNTLTPNRDTRTLTPRRFVANPVLATQVFEVERTASLGGGRVSVGYMMYNSFNPSREAELVAAFRDGFSARQIDSFILDLRYNKSGSAETAALLGNLVAGKSVAGKTFAKYIFAESAKANNRTVLFEAHADGIAPRTVYVLTSRHTAGAAELLINALRGLDQSVVKLVVIGETTQGMAAGTVRRTHTADGTDYDAWMLAFRCDNGAGGEKYIYGLVPNGGEVDEWKRGDNLKWISTWGWNTVTGALQDQMVKRAVDIIRGTVDTPSGGVNNAPQRKRTGYPREFCVPTNMTIEVSE